MSCTPRVVSRSFPAPSPIAFVVATVLLGGFLVGCQPGAPVGEGWLADLPRVDGAVADGASVWFAEPIDGVDAVRWGVFTAAVTEDGASLVDALGVERSEVAMALVQPVEPAPESGSVVVALHPAAGVVLGTVVDRADPEATAPFVAFDWNGRRVEAPVLAAHGVAGELAPLEPVAFQSEGSWFRGLIVALDADQAWIADATGRVSVRPTGEIHALAGLGNDRAVGDAVIAFTWADGFFDGTVEAIEDGGYRIRLGSGTVDRLAATDLVDPAEWFG